MSSCGNIFLVIVVFAKWFWIELFLIFVAFVNGDEVVAATVNWAAVVAAFVDDFDFMQKLSTNLLPILLVGSLELRLHLQ